MISRKESNQVEIEKPMKLESSPTKPEAIKDAIMQAVMITKLIRNQILGM